MGKRGKGGKTGRKKIDADLDGDFNNYEPSESEEEFGKDEKILLDNRRGTKAPAQEEEVFGIHSSSDDEDDDQYYGGGVGSDYDSDIEGKASDADSEEGLPDSKAWGKRSGKYYNTDYVDKDFGGMSKDDEELAEMEEQEAASIQKRLMSHMEETDFTLGLLDKVEEKKLELSSKTTDVQSSSEKIVSDLSRMSKSEKIQLLKRESPELFQLIDDFKENMVLAKEKLLPLINLVKIGKLQSCPAADFVQTLFSVIINYSMNIVFYLMLKSKRCSSIDNHPVIQRLYTYKKIMDEMLMVLEERLIDQIDSIIKAYIEGGELQIAPPSEESEQIPKNRKERRKKKLKILEENLKMEKRVENKMAKLKAEKGHEKPENAFSEDDSGEEQEMFRPEEMDVEEEEEADDDGEIKRSITYEMKKNKGLTPRRKKEDRNPRVKNRNKYRKAKIRRKGQVREVYKQTDKYGGELFGIKAYVAKSVKIKV